MCISTQYTYSQTSQIEEAFENNSFTSKKLTNFQLKGFEKRASQKIIDYANYIQIISDKSYDLSLRKHALNLSKELFANKNVSVKMYNNKISNKNKIELSEYLNLILKSDYSKIVVEISGINILQNLKTNKNNSYEGKISYNETIKFYKNKTITFTDKQKREIEIYLIKVSKNFGSTQTKVRNILLGNIN